MPAGVSLRMELRRILCPALLATVFTIVRGAVPYYGTKIGSFQSYAHDVVGDVYAVDERTIFIKDFSYDGQGPDAYFWGGATTKPDTSGFIIPDERGKKTPLKEYRNKDLLLRLPAGKTLRNTKWLSVWCRKFNANFGDIVIPPSLIIPAPVEIGRIPTKEHGVSSGPVMVVDTQTLLVPEFTYDGLGPAAYWWVSRGSRQHPRGLRLADENGSYAPLPKYTGRTVVITLPDDLTVYDFDWFGVWCEEARVDFGSVPLPQNIVVPPSPRTLGVELEYENPQNVIGQYFESEYYKYKLNCEVLRDDLGYEVRWIMDGEDIVMQLVARLEPGEYMAFGLSKNDSVSEMNNADAIVAFIDKRRKGHAVDYYLGSKEQCVGRRGSCPDAKFPDGQNSVTLLNSAVVNGYTMITLKRPQVGLDEKYDQHVYSDGPQAVVWAIGQLNDKKEVSYHGAMKSEGDIYIDFARPPQWNCPQPAEPEYKPEPSAPPTTTTKAPRTTTKKPTKRPSSSDRARKPKPTSETFVRKPQPIGPRYASRAADVAHSASNVNTAWNVPPVICPADRTLRAQIGPTGGKKGYQSITGETGWGVAWYINGVLIPEITLERGKTYTFIVEGGNDPENSARSHPFYITDDPEGGYDYKTAEEKKGVKIYAGVTKDRRGSVTPYAMGRLCEYKLPKDLTSEDFDTFEEFQENLELKCERGKPGRFTFRPDKDTPDLLYYQCFTHRYLGWKIHVVDSCDEKGLRYEASVQHVRNITYNTFESDYKRGGEKKKLTSSEEDKYIPKYYGGNDGIPLDLSEITLEEKKEEKKHEKKEEKKPDNDSDSQKNLYYKPSSSVYFSSPKYYFSTSIPGSSELYYKPTTSQKNLYFYTTPESKSHYYKVSTTRAPSSRKPTYKINTPTMEPFRIRDVIHTSGGSAKYNIKPTAAKSHTSHKTHSVSPGQTAPLKLRVYLSTPKPALYTLGPYSGTTKGRSQWLSQQAPGNNNRQKAINNLRTQLSVIQTANQGSNTKSARPNQRGIPANAHYERSFIPVVIKNNGSFDTVVARAPGYHHPHGSPSGYTLALSATSHNGKNIVPVLIRANQPDRRGIDNSARGGIQTPLGKLPYPNTSARNKASGVKTAQASGETFLPLLVPHNNKTTDKKSVAPLIPLVVPEKKDDNLYILHQMLSLLNENPQSIAARGVKIIATSKERNIRPRIKRSADHHRDHDHEHDHSSHSHEDSHDHDHENHHMNHTNPSKNKTTSGNTLFTSSLQLLMLALIISLFKGYKSNVI